MIAVQLIGREVSLIDRLPERPGKSVHKFRAELHGQGGARHRDVLGSDPPADAVTRLDNGHLPATLGQSAAGRQPRDAGAQYQDIEFDVVGLRAYWLCQR